METVARVVRCIQANESLGKRMQRNKNLLLGQIRLAKSTLQAWPMF